MPQNGSVSDPIYFDDEIYFEMSFWNQVPNSWIHITLHFQYENGITAFTTSNVRNELCKNLPAGIIRSTFSLPKNFLNRGIYSIDILAIKNGSQTAFRLDNALEIEIYQRHDKNKVWLGKRTWNCKGNFDWTTSKIDENK